MNFVNAVEMSRYLTGVSGPFCAYGSFGIIDGAGPDNDATVKTDSGYLYSNGTIEVRCSFEQHENGVFLRRDTLKNTGAEPITLNCYASRFCFEGAPFSVYTQYNHWERESLGGWQPLHTGVCAENLGIRTSEGAAPIAALKNELSGRGFVFHLIPNAKWKISVKRRPGGGKNDLVTVELGINERGLNLTVAPGETIEMPEIIAYEFANAADLDAWKLHALCNKLWPRKKLPVLYNTWLLNFDKIDVDNILAQAETAARMGVEYFLIDAGWFGVGDDWWSAVGDWEENLTGGFCGRLKEVSDFVRSKGMRFGLWLEPERAFHTAKICREHPEYFFGCGAENVFLDFANEDAFNYILSTVTSLIERYNIGYIKFDFNANISYDPHGSCFYRYFAAHRRFVSALRERYPELYITNCASGGMRLDLAHNILFDSTWLSDNQGPLDDLRILKESMLRLPPAVVEMWNVQRFVDGFPQYGSRDGVTRPVVCNNATWDMLTSVTDEFWFGLFFGGVFGYSCDIASFPESYKQKAAEFIARFKAERDIWQNSVCRLVADGDGITVLQYENAEAGRAMLLVFTAFIHQEFCRVYPRLDGGWHTSDGDCACDGITVEALRDNDCRMIELFRD